MNFRSLLKFNRIILDSNPAPEALSATCKLDKAMLYCTVLGVVNIEQARLRIKPCKVPNDTTTQFDSRESTHNRAEGFPARKWLHFPAIRAGEGTKYSDTAMSKR